MKLELHLDTLKVGSEVTIVRPAKDGGEPSICYVVYVVTEWDERLQQWHYKQKNNNRAHGAFPADGGCRDFMSKNKEPDFYMSANPEHIKAARDRAKRVAEAAARKKAEDMAKFNEFKQKLDSLLEEYGASIYAEQTRGDDHGVEVAAYIEINGISAEV